MGFDEKCFALARVFFEDNRDTFPVNKHTALLKLLAQDIQDEIEGFFEFPDLTLQHLARIEEREAEELERREVSTIRRMTKPIYGVAKDGPEATYQGFKAARLAVPHTSLEAWELLFGKAETHAMERRFQRELLERGVSS